jgi:hypothetical protein
MGWRINMKKYMMIDDQNEPYYIKANSIQECFYEVYKYINCTKDDDNDVAKKSFMSMDNFDQCNELLNLLNDTTVNFMDEIVNNQDFII